MKCYSMASLTLMLAVSLLGCSEEDDVKIVQAGQNLSGSSFFEYSNPDGDNDCDEDCDSTTDVCDLVNTAQSLALIRVGGFTKKEYDYECTDETSFSLVFEVDGEVLAVAAGRSLPQTQEFFLPEIGFDSENCINNGIFWAGVRFVKGRTWLTYCLLVDPVSLEPEPPRSDKKIQLPGSFEELSRQSIEAMADFENVCPDERPADKTRSDAIFARLEECPPPAPFVPNDDPPEDDEGEDSPDD